MNSIIKGEIPFVRVLLPLIAGICAGFIIPSQAIWLIVGLSIISFLLFVYALLFYRFHAIYKRRWLPGIFFHAFIIFSAYAITVIQSQKADTNNFTKATYNALVVSIASEPKLSGHIVRFQADVNQGYAKHRFYNTSGKIIISISVDTVNAVLYKYGDVLLIPATYNETEPAYNPGEFDYKNYLANHAIYQQAYFNHKQVQVLKKMQGNIIISYALAVRQKLVLEFNRHIHDKDAAAVASTLILGYKADLNKEVLDAYAKTGTMHVLSVSGMHVGIVFFVLSFLLGFMDKSKSLRICRACMMIGLIWLYALISGFSPSVCRAALMLTIVVAGKAINRSANSYNLVAASAVILLVYNPFFLADVGFQLSYLAVLGLIYLYPKLYHLFYVRNWFANQLWACTALSIAAQSATFPVSMFYFHQFPLCFLISNVFILLPVTIMMYAGLAFILFPVYKVQQCLGWFLEKCIVFTNKGLFYIEDLPYANITGIRISTWYYLLIYVFIFLIVFACLYKQKRFMKMAAAVFLVLITTTSVKECISLKQKHVVFYSLYKHSAIGFFDGQRVFLFTNLQKDDKSFSFSIQPSLELFAVKTSYFLRPGKPFLTNRIYTDGHFIQFRNWKLLVYNHTFKKRQPKKPVFVNAVLLCGNPAVSIKSLALWLRFNTIYVDGSNTDYKIAQWKKEAAALGINVYVLKKKPACIISL